MEKPENGCSVAPNEPPRPCHVVCTEEHSRDGDTITVKTTWSCSSHDPGDRCIVGSWMSACKAIDSTKLQIGVMREAIERAINDSESGKGWGPDVTVVEYLRKAITE